METIESIPDNELLQLEGNSEDSSKTKELVIYQSKEKKKQVVQKEIQILPRGEKAHQEALGLHYQDSETIDIPLNLKKRKNKGKFVVQCLIWNCRGLRKKGFYFCEKSNSGTQIPFSWFTETMNENCSDSLLRKFDTNQD